MQHRSHRKAESHICLPVRLLRCFRNITGCVCSRTIHFCAVFSGECAATVTRHAAVGVHNDLTSGRAAVSVRTADNETSGRIDKEFCILINHLCRQNLVKYIFFNILMDLLLGYFLVMLGGRTTASRRDGLPFSSYSTVTCVLPSGRR